MLGSSNVYLDLDAPTKLKQELDTVLTLQTELNQIDDFIQHIQKTISQDVSNPKAHKFLDQLCQGHQDTINKVEGLYISLNVTDTFPGIQGLPLEFICTLLLAQDLKINIRKQVIRTFFKWDKLDQVAGGQDQPLGWYFHFQCDMLLIFAHASGTKLHQQMWKAIQKCTLVLLTAIWKFNHYCDTLAVQYQLSWEFPLPPHLPTTLNEL